MAKEKISSVPEYETASTKVRNEARQTVFSKAAEVREKWKAEHQEEKQDGVAVEEIEEEEAAAEKETD